MNQISIEGGLTKDAEFKKTQKDKSILNFSVGCDDGSGEYKKTSYFNCTIFGKFADAMQSILVKGQKVVLFGRMEQWNSEKDGVKKSGYTCIVDQLKLVGAKKAAETDVSDTSEVYDGEDPFASAN